jgi:hypothetical protein
MPTNPRAINSDHTAHYIYMNPKTQELGLGTRSGPALTSDLHSTISPAFQTPILVIMPDTQFPEGSEGEDERVWPT